MIDIQKTSYDPLKLVFGVGVTYQSLFERFEIGFYS